MRPIGTRSRERSRLDAASRSLARPAGRGIPEMASRSPHPPSPDPLIRSLSWTSNRRAGSASRRRVRSARSSGVSAGSSYLFRAGFRSLNPGECRMTRGVRSRSRGVCAITRGIHALGRGLGDPGRSNGDLGGTTRDGEKSIDPLALSLLRVSVSRSGVSGSLGRAARRRSMWSESRWRGTARMRPRGKGASRRASACFLPVRSDRPGGTCCCGRRAIAFGAPRALWVIA